MAIAVMRCEFLDERPADDAAAGEVRMPEVKTRVQYRDPDAAA
jgi:hypothetical protein